MNTTPAEIQKLATSIAEDAPPPTTSELPSLTGALNDTTGGQLNETANAQSSDIDSSGSRWDAALHSPGKTRKKDGTWRAKTGASTGGAAKPALNLPGQAQPAPVTPPHLSDAQALVNLITGAATGFFGPDWKPAPDEHAQMTEGTRTTLEAYGGFNMPPWAGMGIAFLMYGAARFHLKSTQTRVASFGEKVSRFWAGIRAKADRKMAKPEGKPQGGNNAPVVPTVQLPAGAQPGFDSGLRAI